MARINYQDWNRLNLSVANIKLDKDNPRIPTYSMIRNSRDIINYMFESEQVLRLARKIVDKGFISHDPIYVIKESDSYIVVEGNRRVTALKCLLDPDLAPSLSIKKNLSLLKNKLGEDLIEKIEVYVAPSRKDVENVLFELHAEGKLQWSRQQKNKFIAEIGLNNGESAYDIAQRFNVKVADIIESVQEYLIERYFTELSLPTDIEKQVLQQKFSISTLSRFLNTGLFTTSTGFKIDKNYITTTASKEYFNYLVSNIVIDIVNKKVDSRKHNSLESREEYLQNLINKYPRNIEGTPVSFSPPAGGANLVESKPRQSVKSKSKERLIPNTHKYSTGTTKLDVLIEEAQGMWIDTHKTAGALLLRTILELSVVRVFEVNNSKNQCINPNGRVKNLSDNLAALCKRENWFDDKVYRSDLQRFIDASSQSWVSLESLNRYAHGEFILPDREMLRSVWMITKPLVDMIEKSTLKPESADV